MHQVTNRRKREPTAFSIYLRTGRCVPNGRIEVKFNPWHDPEDGRFTFARRGTYYPGNGQDGAGQSHSRRSGGGSATGSGGERNGSTPSSFRRGGSGGGGGATGSWDTPKDRNSSSGFRGGGGSFGGGGATGSWEQSKPKRAKATRVPARRPIAAPSRLQDSNHSGIDRRPPSAAAQAPRTEPKRITKNGYTYEFDTSDRTSRVTGNLILEAAGRSKTNQINAGKPDRLPTDQGGHYIAQRFNGPTDAFNHFAQNENFNKSGYARLEYKWEMAIKKGHEVFVDIRSYYENGSRRPVKIEIKEKINGKYQTYKFNNSQGGES